MLTMDNIIEKVHQTLDKDPNNIQFTTIDTINNIALKILDSARYHQMA